MGVRRAIKIAVDVGNGLADKLLGLTRYFFQVWTLAILLGVFLVVLGILKGSFADEIFGTRLILFGFGWAYMRHTPTLFARRNDHELEEPLIPVFVRRLFDWDRWVGLMFLSASLAPTRYFLELFHRMTS
jgi:hypothetical protein